jgi:uncharacterized protein (TIGR02466 family)
MYKSVVLPLFSSPVVVYKISENFDIDTECEFIAIESEDATGAYISKRKNILDDYPKLKHLILDYFNHHIQQVYAYHNIEFKITTSWLSKVVYGSSSQYHKHSNSMFSAVYYFDVCENAAPLQFKNNGVLSNFCLPTTEGNLYNLDTQSIQPEKNYLIFFPSYLDHRIGHHKGKETRYSLACNFFPVGELGMGDSYLNLELK